MQFADAVHRRRMVRSFAPDPVPAPVLDSVLATAQRGPSAGFTQGVELVVLEGPDQTAGYWQITLADSDARDRFPWPGLLAAPVLVVVVIDPSAYVRRYAEPDKAASGLGGGEDRWPVPYWWVDAGMAAVLALLAAVDEGLGGLFFGLFEHERAVLGALGVPDRFRAAGTIALGYPAPDDRPTGSAVTRPRRPPADVVHRGRW